MLLSNLRTDEIPCILLPIASGHLLLPNVAVAEVFSHAVVTDENEDGSWLIGKLAWRGLELPAVSFERFNGFTEHDIPKDPRAVVLNGILGRDSLPFYSILVDGLPRLVRVKPSDLSDEKLDSLPLGEICRVSLDDQEMVIPNLDLIEERLDNVA